MRNLKIQVDFSIRLVEKDDLPFITEIRSDEETKKYLGTFIMLSKEKQDKWFENLQNDNLRMYLILEKHRKGFLGEEHIDKIGYIRITDIDYINRSMCIGGDIAVEYRGKGYGKEMYKLIFDLGFNKLNMNRLWLLVLETNKIAMSLYEKIGFKIEGVQRKAIYKNGEYYNYIMMSMLRNEWQQSK